MALTRRDVSRGGIQHVTIRVAYHLFWLFLHGLLQVTVGQTVINKIEPNGGSVNGGTRLTIYGSGFGDHYVTSSVVYVGPYPCDIITHLSSTEVLTCETSPGLPGSYQVTVAVTGQNVATHSSYFSYRDELTPTFSGVLPRAGPPGTRPSLYGDYTNRMSGSDCQEDDMGEVNCVGSIVFGDYLCRQDSSLNTVDISFISGFTRYGDNKYMIGCVLSTPEATESQPDLGVANSMNITIHFEGSLRGGVPKTMQTSFQYDSAGRPYQFQLFSEVANITPAVGSIAGGTLLKISGRGFPDSSLGLNDTINISILGVPCEVVDSTFDTISCVTGAKPATPPPTATPIRGLYPGMRGIEYEFYNLTYPGFNANRGVSSFSDMWRLNSTIFLNNTLGFNSSRSIQTSAYESAHYTERYHCTHMKGFFIAPRTSNYSFYMQADDWGGLNATWMQGGVERSGMIVNLTRRTCTDKFFESSAQASQPIALVEGQHVLLQSAHCNYDNVGLQQIGFRMEVPTPQSNSISEVQEVSATADLSPPIIYIKYLYGAGQDTSAVNINIRSLEDSKLSNPALGLEIVFVGAENKSVVLPLTATSIVMDGLIQTKLNIASGRLFGVRKIRRTGSLSLQLGFDKSLASISSPSSILARLVVINKLSTTAPSTCENEKSSPLPPSLSVLTAGMNVTVSSAATVPAVVPSGNFQLRCDQCSPINLPFNAITSTLSTAISNMTGLTPTSVTLDNAAREGVYYAYVWAVTFAYRDAEKVPLISVAPTTNTPAGVVVDFEVRPSTPPLTGSFRLAFGSSCNSVMISLLDSADTISAKLAMLPGMAKPKRVNIFGNASIGYRYLVTFDPVATPGNQPSLRASDVSGLDGKDPSVTVTTIMDGSTDAMYGPIPSEFMRIPVTVPDAVSLSVNGVPAACAHQSGVCGFTYSTTVTPTITSVSPTSMSFSSKSSLPLTITGTLFDASPSVTVKVGAVDCKITSRTATQIVCSLPDTAPAGIRRVTVQVDGVGYAAGSATVRLETLYVLGTPASQAAVASVGMTIFNITGKGFDSINCGNNKLYIGGVQCGVVACGGSFVTVMYPGNPSGGVSAASITAEVYEGTTLIDQDTPTTTKVQISSSAPAIQGVLPASMPGAGGRISVTLLGATASNVASVFMVQQSSSISNYNDVAKAYKGRIPCGDVTPTTSGVSCSTPAMPNGRYHVLVVLSTGTQVLSSDTISFDLVITNVTPNLGSIGGGTLITIAGSGFSLAPSENAVFLTVPVTTTFLNGLIQCLTVSVNTTHLICRTQPHLAANADGNDPFARAVVPIPTDARAITVIICDSSYDNSYLREYCSTLPETPRARCAASGTSSCNFGYSTVNTPDIASVSNASYFAGDRITIRGSYMKEVTVVEFLLNGVVQGYGSALTTEDNAVRCTAPDLPPGVYTLRLKKANGEMSVNYRGRGTYKYAAAVMELSDNVGSLAGGLPMSIRVGGAGLALGNNSAHVVTVAGLPCPIMAVHNRTHLTCRAPSIHGFALAEYWNLAVNTYTMPDLITLTDPDAVRLERYTSFNWGDRSPIPGTIQLEFWAARFTFYYQMVKTEELTFRLQANDEARLYIDDEYMGGVAYGGRTMDARVTLNPGVHKIVVALVEYTGSAYMSLSAAVTQPNGRLSNFTALDSGKVTAYPPGVAQPVNVIVNGVAAVQLCPETKYTLPLPSRPDLSFEPSVITVANLSCSYIYSSHRTPSLVTVRGDLDEGILLNGIATPNFTVPTATLSMYGNLLLNRGLPAVGQVSVMIANQTCVVNSVTPVTQDSTGLTNVTRIMCTLPALPAGPWPVNINVAGLGFVRPVASEMPTVTYALRVNRLISPAMSGSSPCQLSMFGGGTFTVGGYGMVKDVMNNDLRRNMTAVWEDHYCPGGKCIPCMPDAANSPTCIAAQDSSLKITPLSSDGMTSSFRLNRIAVSNPSAYAGASNVQLFYKIRAFYNYTNNPQYETMSSPASLSFCGGRTPVLSSVSPSSPAPDSGATLSLTWMLSGVGSSTLSKTEAGTASNAIVEFEVGSTVLACTDVTVTASAITATNYTESITCKLPKYLPAANYTLWLCIQPFGCGLVPAYQVPLTVSSISANTGSSAGGVSVTITGKGFDTNSSRVAARFGNSICTVTDSTATSITCITGALGTKPSNAITWPLSITPTVGARETTYPALAFTFDPALESTFSSISPARGSSQGGTPVTITGTRFVTGISTKVTIGDTPCTSVVVVSSTTITCTTGKPPTTALRAPQPVNVFQEGRGSPRGSVTYHYIDLWSRNSTWAGGPLPGYEDTVIIPSGVTVLLDMSPPKLLVLILEGNLEFDDTQPYINLQAHYIIVKGGNFSIGKPGKPFPGRANITMHGSPFSRDLPLYGAKTLAVRDGVVSFVGQPKEPTYTTLNKTVEPGATEIIINGGINWQVGDAIAIASSSFYGNETHEATIVAIDSTRVPGCTVLTLDAPTKYTHLGEIHSQAGVATPLDMRTEVAVLTRNIVLMGDWTSRKNMYGVQVLVNSPRSLPRALIQIDNVEVTQSGQAFRLGRYSIHWHMHGDVRGRSWVRGCSIHHTYNRAITIHGTHNAIIQNTVAYNVMGHTFFLEDGIETGNLIEGNLAFNTKASDALLNTDTTPASYWITNPNNTVRHNRAGGSAGYGFWYRFLDNPEGPSYTPTVCPKFTELKEFTNNTAHSNMFYGVRVHPEFYPRINPCQKFGGTFQQVPAVFNGVVAYKNGMKGFVCTQVGLLQVKNIVVGDNGGGPREHQVNGKDLGGQAEMSWVTDDRNQENVKLTEMAGFVNITVYSRTKTGNRGNAGFWPSCRRIAGVISQSPVSGHPKHSALMSVINATFVDWVRDIGGCNAYFALESCGKCKQRQGGSTTFTAGVKFVSTNNAKPRLSYWSWGHQGIFVDTDGTLLNRDNLPADLLPPAGANWTFGPGASWHSAILNDMFDPAECVYVRRHFVSNDGAYCSPALRFRRLMLNHHGPSAIAFKSLVVVDAATNRSTTVLFSVYNENGYQFTVPAGREYWVHWDINYRVDPLEFNLHKMELGNLAYHTYLSTKYMQIMSHFKVNSKNNINMNNTVASMPLPLATTPHGANYYNRHFTPNSWWWGNNTYNDTKFTIYLDGRTDSTLRIAAVDCPDEGCSNLPDETVDIRNGTLYWSELSTWDTSVTNFKKPVAGDNVTIPYGWDLVIDESPPALNRLIIEGTVRFDPTRDIELTATYILVMFRGVLMAGSADAPHPTAATILLNGYRSTPHFVVDNNLNLGSAVLAAVEGGTIQLYGRKVNRRWTRLATPAFVNDTSITVSDPTHSWRVGDRILITSTSYNYRQTEFRDIVGIRNKGSQLILDSPLAKPHGAVIKAYPNGPTVDMRAEVGMVSSNVLITSVTGRSSYGNSTELFGARVVVSGTSVGLFSGIAMEYCGQAGHMDHACIIFDRIQTNSNDSSKAMSPNMLDNSALLFGMNSNVRINGHRTEKFGVRITNNVMYESFDNHSVQVTSSNNIIAGNLVLGTTKDMDGKSHMQTMMPSCFFIATNNYVEDNVAAGSDRYGFSYMGLPCDSDFSTGIFRNNSAHSCLAGLWLQPEDEESECTVLKNFTTYMNWDFGIISTSGITSDVYMEDVNILDSKHAGLHLMRKSSKIATPASITWNGGLLSGQSSNDVCNACANLGDDGCHKKLSVHSYNVENITAAFGMVQSQFGMKFVVGPDKSPWDKPMGYALIHGKVNVTGVTIADFLGPAGCGGPTAGTYALSNHPKAPEAFHPHFFSRMNVINVTRGSGQGMFYHFGTDPAWRTEDNCGEANYPTGDGKVIPLTCAGPKHIHWRDLDGTLTGTVGVTAGGFINTPRLFPMDQGTPVVPGPCTYNSDIDSYSCAAGSNSFLLDARYKPNPIPADGIFGDPQHFVLESRDPDTEDRNFGPVLFNVSGSIDLVTVAMDHLACFSYFCQKRLSTFWTYLPTGQTIYINFTGSPSQNFRYWFPYADPNKEIVLVIDMKQTLNRRFIWLPPGVVPGRSGRVSPQSKPVTIGDGTGHGDYYWDQDNTLLYVKMKGGKMLESRTESAVLISQSFATSIDSFYNVQSRFIRNLASIMDIDDSRIYIVKVVPGTVTVQFGIGPSQNVTLGDLPDVHVSVGLDEAYYNVTDGSNTTRQPPPPPPPPPVTSNADDSHVLMYQELSAAYSRFAAAIVSPDASAALGIQPVGQPTANWDSLQIPKDVIPPGTAASPPPPPARVTTDAPPSGTTSNPAPSPKAAKDGVRVIQIAGVIAGIAVGCAMAVLIAVFVVSRQKRQHTHQAYRTTQATIVPSSSGMIRPGSGSPPFLPIVQQAQDSNAPLMVRVSDVCKASLSGNDNSNQPNRTPMHVKQKTDAGTVVNMRPTTTYGWRWPPEDE